jgi:hypothetical protein
MDWLDRIIVKATKAIPESYFHLKVHDSSPVWRERVYCYELYHQMRLCWPDNCQYVLTGELDKNGHPFFKEQGASPIIPDFLVHIPGKMANLAAIEVKSKQARLTGVDKDVTNLRFLRDMMGYNKTIQLVFGSPRPNAHRNFPNDIELWHHAEAGTPAERIPPTPHEDQPSRPTNFF